ncbi:transcriptional adapter 3-B-like isoform X2 [Amphibalanus amphitrite]|nr:transcriptional adapter 3-B-like [Amphibalanus amphitrite]XP_043246758.1 transcriptional adapter 3-B-like isoform X2 [Amphibalanus amphitrite]XP_043246759.1 transcriptional adapter 3-B-like isoform X2 [Amphibalanus amphitrite]XP_043246760.1 transcriptional adapter 3-B-like isoform X2 [Amphibalanus amphitrite]XP_043246761.1 transcriptional adapter 3-B-like isoform X2 [Amphibalanus amphitrite]XP_043246762.1 transcriptional adapter 3-B-like isoform X2 [Amphibalanus amphitrite]XP_043246763.1 t
MAPKPKHQKTSKGKEHSKSKDENEVPIKLDHCALNFPEVLAIDHEFSLPKYTAVVSRPDGSISMEDVDRIQLELEALLSAATIRRKTLSAEIKLINSLDKRRSRPITTVAPSSPGKLSRSVDRPAKKFKDSLGRAKDATPLKPTKIRISSGPSHPPEHSADILPQIKADPCLPSPPVKNDVPNKFWAAMEQYCGPITAKDVEMLERLSAEEEDMEEYLSAPPLGKHYTLRWAEEDGTADGESGDDTDSQSGAKAKGKGDDEAAGLGALTQRLVSGLVEENSNAEDATETEGKETDSVVARPGLSSSVQLSTPGQLERRLRKELQNQGLVDDSDGPSAVADDQVLAELERCQARLRTLSAHNASQLERLLRLAKAELQRQELREKLAATDAQVQEAYQAVAAARQRKKSPSKKEREAAWKALKERDAIIKMMDAL